MQFQDNKDGDLKIVKAVEYQSIYNLMERCRDDFYNQAFNRDDIIDNLAHKFAKFGIFFVAYYKEEPAGFVAFYANDSTKEKAYISMIIIRSGFQHKRIGSSLLEKTITFCKDKEFQTLSAEIDDTNIKSIKFFKKHHFKYFSKASNKSSYYILKVK